MINSGYQGVEDIAVSNKYGYLNLYQQSYRRFSTAGKVVFKHCLALRYESTFPQGLRQNHIDFIFRGIILSIAPARRRLVWCYRKCISGFVKP